MEPHAQGRLTATLRMAVLCATLAAASTAWAIERCYELESGAHQDDFDSVAIERPGGTSPVAGVYLREKSPDQLSTFRRVVEKTARDRKALERVWRAGDFQRVTSSQRSPKGCRVQLEHDPKKPKDKYTPYHVKAVVMLNGRRLATTQLGSVSLPYAYGADGNSNVPFEVLQASSTVTIAKPAVSPCF